MMVEPPIGNLMKRMDSRYSLVIAVAKRARELADGDEAQVVCDSDKEVTVAVHELGEGKLSVHEAQSA